MLAAGCSLLFSYEEPKPARDSGPPPSDAAADAPRDAALDAPFVDPCPELPLTERGFDNCRCGEPCGPRRPYCCSNGCCAEECGSFDNDCSFGPELPVDAGPWDAGWMDATHPERVDGGCDPYERDSCLGCGVPCPDHRPFCCGAICCAQECGSFAADCSTDPEPIVR